jgi:hypothetical protein
MLAFNSARSVGVIVIQERTAAVVTLIKKEITAYSTSSFAFAYIFFRGGLRVFKILLMTRSSANVPAALTARFP